MKASVLKAYFEGQISHLDFLATISHEVTTYSELLNKVGSSIPLSFEEDVKITLTKSNFKKLLEESIFHNTSSFNLSYICDCITLSEVLDYSDETVNELVFEFADPEINGGHKSKDEILSFINDLQ